MDSVCWCKRNKIDWVFNRVFITKGKGEGKYNTGRAGDLINMGENKINVIEASELTTLALVAIKIQEAGGTG